MAYTTNLFGAGSYSLASPVYAYLLTYSNGPFKAIYDHEEEWWHGLAGFNRLRVYVGAASYDFKFAKLYAFYDRITVAEPYDHSLLGFFGDHKGYHVGATIPVASSDLVKVSWNRRDSPVVENTCNKVGVGYQHNFNKHAYLYTDYARITNGAKGTCTIAYTNEQTSNDLGAGDSGGYGTQGVDFGFVLKF